eukprot:2496548-Pleurochrysis_carterae.AAC.1
MMRTPSVVEACTAGKCAQAFAAYEHAHTRARTESALAQIWAAMRKSSQSYAHAQIWARAQERKREVSVPGTSMLPL